MYFVNNLTFIKTYKLIIYKNELLKTGDMYE